MVLYPMEGGAYIGDLPIPEQYISEGSDISEGTHVGARRERECVTNLEHPFDHEATRPSSFDTLQLGPISSALSPATLTHKTERPSRDRGPIRYHL